MSKKRPADVIELDDELDDYEVHDLRNDINDPCFDFDVQEYISDNESDLDQEYITIDDDDEDEALNGQSDRDHSATPTLPERVELEHITLDCGTIEPGDVVELKDQSERGSEKLPRGDFLLVKFIKENLETEEAFLYGYKLRRTTHVAPTFNRHINDLFMFLNTREGDYRPPFEQGLVEIPVDEAMRKRKCTFTHLRENVLCMSDVTMIPQSLTTSAQKFEYVFNKGTLICRYVYTIGFYGKTRKSYKGEARFIYKRECREFSDLKSSRPDPILALFQSTPATSSANKHERSSSLEEVKDDPAKQRKAHPQKTPRYIFNDFFCGIGGVSDAARQADFQVSLGLEKDKIHMRGYGKNFPGAAHLRMCAHDFPSIARRGTHGADHCHFSCPCQYWSMAHTIAGKNDEANMMTIYTPGPILKKLKPSTVSFEQAPGLLIQKAHSLYFRSLINQCLDAGYNLRWEIQDMAWHGLSQHRPRLVILGAKVGIPIPPLAKPERGPVGSGLKPYRYPHDAFEPLRRRGQRGQNDPYHKPQDEKQFNKPKLAYDSKRNLAATVTTNGGNQPHFSGLRPNTVRELSLLQGFGINYHFEGTKTQARTQAGNAWGPIAAKPQLLSCAATKEAWDKGLIGDEDHIDDLYEHLESKGFNFPKTPSAQFNPFAVPLGTANLMAQYRYINQLEKTVRPRTRLVIFQKDKKKEPLPQRRNNNNHNASQPFNFSSGLSRRLGGSSNAITRPVNDKKRPRNLARIEYSNEIIIID